MISPWRSRRDIRRAQQCQILSSSERGITAGERRTLEYISLCSIARARARTDSRLEIRKREIASRGDTHGGLKLCRYRRVARPGRGQEPSFLLLARATANGVVSSLSTPYPLSSFRIPGGIKIKKILWEKTILCEKHANAFYTRVHVETTRYLIPRNSFLSPTICKHVETRILPLRLRTTRVKASSFCLILRVRIFAFEQRRVRGKVRK